MNRKNGFTLVELLAVLTLLAIISLIAVPVTFDIISKSKQSTEEVSAKNYISAINQSILSYEIGNKKISDGTYSIMQSGNICLGTLNASICSDTNVLIVELDGIIPTEGNVVIEGRKVKQLKNVKIGDKYINTDESDINDINISTGPIS